jgi:hypothetical protein
MHKPTAWSERLLMRSRRADRATIHIVPESRVELMA